MSTPLTIVSLKGEALTPMAHTPKLTYHQGKLLTSVEVYTIFWGTGWQQAPQNGLIQQLNMFFDFILTSSLIDLLGEYSVPGQTIGHGRRVGTNTITTSDPGTMNPDGSRVVTDAQIQQALQDWINNGTLPQPNSNTLFFVYLPPNVTSEAFGTRSCVSGGYCGYHDAINHSIFYAVIPYIVCGGCSSGQYLPFDSLTEVSSHELCEAIADPDPTSGWNDDNLNPGEIGDICNFNATQLGSYNIQQEWSNKAKACLSPVESLLFPPLAVISAVSSVPAGVSLFAVGGGGVVRSTYYDPRMTNPQWVPWFPLPADQLFRPLAVVSAVSSVQGGVSLFAVGIDGVVRSTYYDPHVANPQWVPWFPLPVDQPFLPSTVVSAVSSVQGGVSLFAVGSDGVVRSTYYDPHVANPQWVPWFPLPADQPFLPSTVVSAVSSVQGGVSLFAVGSDGVVRSTYYDPHVANPQWVPWFPLPADQPFLPSTVVSAVSSVQGGVSLFAVGSDGVVRSTYYDPHVANPQWVPWFPLPADQPFLPSTVVSAVSSVQGGVSLFAVGSDGVVRSTYYDPHVANPQWVPWFPLPADQPFLPSTVVSAVSSVQGGVSLFAVGSDGVVRSTYYDPYVANPQWVSWFPLS